MAWAAILKSVGSKAAMQSGKKIAEKITKKVTEKKTKVTGKDVAKKMLGGGGDSSEGGALVVRPSTSIVSSPAGGLVSTKKDEGGGSLVVSNDSKDLGLTPFLESVIGVKESVRSIKDSLNDNAKDAEKRLEKQRVLNAQLEKEEQEEKLETKKPGLGKKLLAPATKAGKSFLQKLKTFFTNILLGMFVNALIGGSRDVVVAFILGFKAYRMAKDAVIKFVLKLRGNIVKGIKDSAKSISKVGSSLFNFLGKVRIRLVQWIKNGIKVIQEGIRQSGRVGGRLLRAVKPGKRLKQTFKVVNNLRKNISKIRKNPLQTLKSIKDSGIGRKVGGTLKKGKNLLSKMIKGGSKGPGLFGQLKNLGGRAVTGLKSAGTTVVKQTAKQAGRFKNFVGDGINSLKGSANKLMKGAAKKIKAWKKNIEAMLELAGNPAKLFEKAKAFLDGKLKDVVKNNKTWKQLEKFKNMKPEKMAGKIGGLLNGLKKSKEVMKVVGVLKTAKQNMKLPMLDRILALILGVIDYTLLGESPINATLKALGGLLGFSFGTALGAPLGPGAFVTGVAGGFVGEQLGNRLSQILASIPGIKDLQDPIAAATPGMKPRPLVRNPYGKGAEEFDKQQEELASANFAAGKSSVSYTADEISQSASYEEGAEEEIVVIDSGQANQTASVSKAGQTKFIPLDQGDGEVLNTLTNATLYKA